MSGTINPNERHDRERRTNHRHGKLRVNLLVVGQMGKKALMSEATENVSDVLPTRLNYEISDGREDQSHNQKTDGHCGIK